MTTAATPNQALERTAPRVTPAAPPPSPAQPSRRAGLVQVHDDGDVFQSSPEELPAIDIHSL